MQSHRIGRTLHYTAEKITTTPVENEELVLFCSFAASLSNANRMKPRVLDERNHTGSSYAHLSLKDSLPDCLARIAELMAKPQSRRALVSLYPEQEWEGRVVAVEENQFIAQLRDLTSRQSSEGAEAVIPFEEISRYDIPRVKIDSVFRWVIGYEKSIEGTRKRVSQIVFRDFPKVTQADIEAGKKWADSMKSAIGEE